MTTFWILWIFNALVALMPVYFFFEGMADGSIDGDNFGMWMIILLAVGLILGGSYRLKTKNKLAAARVLLIIAAIPSLLAILFVAIVMGSNPRWN